MTLENQNKSKKDIKRINPFTIVIGKEGNNKLTEKMKNSKKESYLKEAHIFLKFTKIGSLYLYQEIKKSKNP